MPRQLIPCIGLALLCAFVACSKSPSPAAPINPTNPVTPTNPTTPASVTMNVDLIPYQPVAATFTFELIIAEPGGQVLLDTVTTTNSPIIAKIQSADSLVNVTTIIKDSTGYLSAFGYRGVNPSTWKYSAPAPNVQILYPAATYTVADAFFTSVPAAPSTPANYMGDFAFFDYNMAADPIGGYDVYDSTFSTGYGRYPNSYAYVLLPYAGLYKLYKPANDNEILSLAAMDTAATVQLNLPAQFMMEQGGGDFQTKLIGITDTTDLTQSVQLGPTAYTTGLSTYNTYFQIPKTPMQKYETQVSGFNNGSFVYYYNYGSTVPTTPVFPDPGSFMVVSNQSDSFAITFTGQHPTYYRTDWATTGNVSLSLWSSPDSNAVNPMTFLNGLKSKLLSGASFSGLKCYDLQLESITGYNYGSFLNYVSNPTLKTTQRVSTAC
jgi:hypothetical protein